MGGKTAIFVRLDWDVNIFLLGVTISGQDSPWFVADSPNWGFSHADATSSWAALDPQAMLPRDQGDRVERPVLSER